MYIGLANPNDPVYRTSGTSLDRKRKKEPSKVAFQTTTRNDQSQKETPFHRSIQFPYNLTSTCERRFQYPIGMKGINRLSFHPTTRIPELFEAGEEV
ncbi:hypothetical protein PDE_05700 [Penicillium oxalicum 114-2]|uniref:Uncharacterized protein n=2 Tax=Penicillium oxalicum TaxID=69781 RepID=S8AWS1_PENO1|nr:hypothetical protein PDE_05700 [Penicillium oxalicum 114-2]